MKATGAPGANQAAGAATIATTVERIREIEGHGVTRPALE
jgi:hypothetical protein